MTSESTNPPRRERVKTLLFAVTDLPSPDREAYLLEKCGKDGELLEEVKSLLKSYSETDGFLEQPLEIHPPSAKNVECPASIGSYRILKLLGFGGMGVVYLAEQENPRREVALKVLRESAATPEARTRFTREAELLARFTHPGIARVFEAGVAETEVGQRPFFSMEYVKGVPITEYARREGLGNKEVVKLFIKVLNAVEHAHDNDVLHRDMKPGNVLVDDQGNPKVLDFGVAHSFQDGANSTLLTSTGQLIGTVAYMSPEQSRGMTLDARSDQFALGVLLYELLTGELPYDTRGRLVHDALQLLSEGNWKPPSHYDASLRGDLETILATALAQEPVRRYRGLKNFRDDLQAWLNERPIQARPASTLYQARRFISRNRILSTAAVVALLALGAGTGIAMHALALASEDTQTAFVFQDKERLDRLLQEQDELWPTSSKAEVPIREWLQRADDLFSRREAHLAQVALLEAREANSSTSAGERLRLSISREITGALDSFESSGGALFEVRSRLEQLLEQRRLTLKESAGAWRAVAERVLRDERFAGLRLPPQEGLTPLGPDPISGLEEFAVFGTGETPTRDARGASLTVNASHAVVLVLIPGGETRLGVQRHFPRAANFDPLGLRPGFGTYNEGPPLSVRLAPYLLSKFEMTQAQWLRCFGDNPSDFKPGDTIVGAHVTALHPVESMNYTSLMERLPRLGLCLPTEAQWEHAARCGTRAVNGYGEGLLSLSGAANIKWHTRSNFDEPGVEADVDGYVLCHSPIGIFRANAFGLHDVLGNVWEYCQDIYKVDYHARYHAPGDGLVIAQVDGDYTRRGGGFASSLTNARIAARQMRLADSGSTDTGTRPARKLRLAPHD